MPRTHLDRFVSALGLGEAVSGTSRLRRFIVVLVVVIVACAGAVVAQLLSGAWLSALETGSVGVFTMGIVWALRMGAPLAVCASLHLSFGVAMAGLMAIQTGTSGVVSVFWMSAAPLISLTVAGRRAGYVTLILTLATMIFTLYCIEHGINPAPELQDHATFGIRSASLLGAVVTLFFLVLNYDIEAEKSIVRLQEKNQALDEARREADNANRIKTDFLATISHEIRTPLNGVTGMISLLEAEKNPANIRGGLRVLQQSADTLLAIINDVLDLSKIEAQQLKLESAPMEPRAQVALVRSLLSSLAIENNTRVDVSAGDDVPEWVITDPVRWRQIAINLTSNAIKFTQHGIVSLTLTFENQRLVLQVKDSGIGMSEETQRRIFAPFVQADASTTRRFGGTGLGLAICKRLVDAMGGSIGCQSTLGQGSVFRVSVPVSECTLPLQPPVAEQAATSVVARKVLLVEDNVVNQMVALRLLEREGHSVVLAVNGRHALELTEKSHFDAILMDCHMPEVDGFEAAQTMRQRGVSIPIYAITAAVTPEERARCMEVGMDALLPKPLSIKDLAQILRTLPRRFTA